MRGYSVGMATALALLAGQASVHAAPDKQDGAPACFRASDIQNSVQATPTQLNLKTYSNHYLQIQTKGACFIPLDQEPVILHEVPGSQVICHPIDIDLAADRDGFKIPCIVDKIVPLTKDQVTAMPKRLQPG